MCVCVIRISIFMLYVKQLVTCFHLAISLYAKYHLDEKKTVKNGSFFGGDGLLLTVENTWLQLKRLEMSLRCLEGPVGECGAVPVTRSRH